jgi:CheY-like chemotaxis protein
MTTANVLVVEDERIVALDLKVRLAALGYTVSGTVPSGEQALQKAKELMPDIVLMDIHLEGRSTAWMRPRRCTNPCTSR